MRVLFISFNVICMVSAKVESQVTILFSTYNLGKNLDDAVLAFYKHSLLFKYEQLNFGLVTTNYLFNTLWDSQENLLVFELLKLNHHSSQKIAALYLSACFNLQHSYK